MEFWIALSNIGPEGQNFTFSDQTLWRKGWEDFDLAVTPERDMVAEVTVFPQGKGALVQGTLKGAVKIPCDRCAADFMLEIDSSYELYEELPESQEDNEGEPRVREGNGILELDMGALLWEEFLLAMPIKPLCDDNCKGLCPHCGADLNSDPCNCETENGDPRLAVFRNMKIK